MGAIAGGAQCRASEPLKLPGLEARGAGIVERIGVVMHEHLDVVVRALCGQRLDPRRRALMTPSPAGARDLPVGDVPHERVAERVLRFAGHRGVAFAPYELLELEGVEQLR